MAAKWAHAAGALAAGESGHAALSVRELLTEFAARTVVRVAERFTGMSISTSHRCVTHVAATANLIVAAAAVAQPFWDDCETFGVIVTYRRTAANAPPVKRRPREAVRAHV